MSPPILRKALGQHHLVEPSICRPLVDFLAPTGVRLLEIGPGGGVLTRLLLEAGGRVWACEVDRDWALELRRRLPHPELRLLVADAMELAWERLPAGTVVAGNLPFNVGTALIERLLLAAPGVGRAGFLVQSEVAERLAAPPGSKAYGSLSVLTAARAEARILRRVRRSHFRPPPRVDGAFVALPLHDPPLPFAELPAFAATVRSAFAQRRKTLRNSLAAAWGRPAADRAVAALGLEPRARAESLPLDTFVQLHRLRQSEAVSTDL